MIKYVGRIAIIAGLLLTTGWTINTSSIEGCSEENGDCEISGEYPGGANSTITVDNNYDTLTITKDGHIIGSANQSAIYISNISIGTFINNGIIENNGESDLGWGVNLISKVYIENFINNNTISAPTGNAIRLNGDNSHIGILIIIA